MQIFTLEHTLITFTKKFIQTRPKNRPKLKNTVFPESSRVEREKFSFSPCPKEWQNQLWTRNLFTFSYKVTTVNIAIAKF